MKYYFRFGHLFFAIASIGIGIIQIVTGAFNSSLFPVPENFASSTMLAMISGTLFTLAGACVLVERLAVIGSIVLSVLYLIFFLFVHIPGLFHYENAGNLTVPAEVLSLFCGALLTLVFAARQRGLADMNTRWIGTVITGARVVFAACLVIFGALHFIFASFVATLIPEWIPLRLFLTYFVGVAFILVAISLITRFLYFSGTMLLGMMFFSWVLILHIPRVIGKPVAETEWTSLMVAIGFGATAFMFCGMNLERSAEFNQRRETSIERLPEI
jgi:hypothetical protein